MNETIASIAALVSALGVLASGIAKLIKAIKEKDDQQTHEKDK